MEVKSYVMLTLDDYESQKGEMANQEARNLQISNHLMKFESFLKMLDSNDKIIESFHKSLNETGKIGTSLFMTFEEVKENLTIDLKK